MCSPPGRKSSVPFAQCSQPFESGANQSPYSDNTADDVFTATDECVLAPPSLRSRGSERSLSESTQRAFPVKSLVRIHSGDPEQHTPGSARSDESTPYCSRIHSTSLASSTAQGRSIGTLPGSTSNTVSDTIPSVKPDKNAQARGIQVDLARPMSPTNRQGTGTLSRSGLGIARERPSATHLEEPLTTSRFKRHETEEGHYIITGRDVEPLRCEDEPVHAPGAVQGFGMLIALIEEKPRRFVVHLVSENSSEFIGYTPAQLFDLGNLMDIFTEEQQENIQDHFDSIRNDVDNVTYSGPEIFNTSIKNPDGKHIKLWCGAHINPNQPKLIVCEFEREDDPHYPLTLDPIPAPDQSSDTLMAIPTEEGVVMTPQTMVKPLKVPQKIRLGKSTSNSMEIFDLLGQVQDRLAEANSIDRLLLELAGIVNDLTSYHRVMVYHFDSSNNGKVVTELVRAGHAGEPYYGLQFPADDIPAPARELYKHNKMRLLFDRDLQTARMVCRSQADLETPLDMTHCYLRAMSPIHLKYLENMGVQSSMSLSLKAFGELWGLVSCHGVGPSGMRPPFPIRKMCKLISTFASRNLERLSYKTSLQAQKLINSRVINSMHGSEFLLASKDEFLEMFEADTAVVSVHDEAKSLDGRPQSQESLAMLEYLRVKKPSDVIASHDIASDFPDLQYTPGFMSLGGMLYVPLSVDGDSFLVLFRKAQAQEVKWGGNPHENKVEGGHGSLEPRRSFKTWLEVVTGRSREWTAEQIELARVLCAVYGKFIQVWTQNEPASQDSRLKQILLANSAHKIRTPLNAIINYLEIALEGSLDKETRDNLAQSHSASKSLVYVINDLLDLIKTEEGQALSKDEVFDLPACIRQAADSYLPDAKRKHLNYEVEMHSDLPKNVCGDKLQVRQAIANVIANAFQNTSDGSIQVTSYLARADDGPRVEIAVQDTGKGMSAEEINRLFHDLEQIGDMEEPQKCRAVQKLGLGLAVVARTVKNMGGLLRVKSEPGQGSCFVIQLPLGLPDGVQSSSESQDIEPAHGVALAADQPAMLVRTPGYTSAEPTHVPSLNSVLLAPWQRTDNGPKVGGPRQTESRDNIENREEAGETRGPLSQHTRAAVAQVPEVLVPEKPINDGPEGEKTPTPRPVTTTEKPKTAVSTDASKGSAEQTRLHILIAEDDPINVMLLRKRLEKQGHWVHHSINGEDCAMVYRDKSDTFDVVLMDMQMPIMDGVASTKAIRAWERDPGYQGLSDLARRNGKIPIFAVSASLREEDKEVYMKAGFDGWIPKPIDFKRLREIVAGIPDHKAREACLYAPGKWEIGGWFERAGEAG